MENVTLLAWVAALAAAVAGVRYLVGTFWAFLQYLRRVVVKLERLADLADYELRLNGGGSIKDELAELRGQVGSLREDFTAHAAHVTQQRTEGTAP